MSTEIYEVVAQGARYWFLFLMALIAWRSYRWLAKDRRQRRKRARLLPDAGFVGEMVVLKGNDLLSRGEALPVPTEGTLGYTRMNDLCVPVKGVAKRHCWLCYDQEEGLLVEPCMGCTVTVDGQQRTGRRDPLYMGHGSRLTVGDAELRLRLFAGYETVTNARLRKDTEDETPPPQPAAPTPEQVALWQQQALWQYAQQQQYAEWMAAQAAMHAESADEAAADWPDPDEEVREEADAFDDESEGDADNGGWNGGYGNHARMASTDTAMLAASAGANDAGNGAAFMPYADYAALTGSAVERTDPPSGNVPAPRANEYGPAAEDTNDGGNGAAYEAYNGYALRAGENDAPYTAPAEYAAPRESAAAPWPSAYPPEEQDDDPTDAVVPPKSAYVSPDEAETAKRVFWDKYLGGGGRR